MTLATNGNLGIGTPTPQSKLDVVTATNNFGFSHSDGTTRLSSFVGTGQFGTRGGWIGTATNDPLYFFTNNSVPRLTIFTNGNVAMNGVLAVAGGVQVGFVTSGSVGVCRDGNNLLASCSSSLRYKKNIEAFPSGLSVVNKLQSISYEWKQDGLKDVGFGAEDVEKIDARFVTYNEKGQVEGVKYDRLSVAFVNAFKEQQAQIERQQRQIEALTRLVCLQNPGAELCREEKK